MKGFIYEIICKDVNILDSYIGSTCDFKQRKRQHKFSCNNPNNKDYNVPLYVFIRENGGFDNFEFHILEELEYENRIELLKRERYWVETKKSNLNIQLPSRTEKEYHQDNKDKIEDYQKEWYEKNKEELIEKQKKYYEKNKDKINEKLKEKIQCDLCGSIIRRSDLSRHQKTIKCQEHKNIILLNYNE